MFGCKCEGNAEFYGETKPALDFETYFDGPVKAWGLVQDRRGRVTRRFDIDMVGRWNGDTGTLEEKFTYYDGKINDRVWTLRKLADNRYEGTAADIKGKATGETFGFASQLYYRLQLPVGDKTYLIDFDDRLFLMNDGVVINRTYLRKFGFKVGELTIFMQKQENG